MCDDARPAWVACGRSARLGGRGLRAGSRAYAVVERRLRVGAGAPPAAVNRDQQGGSAVIIGVIGSGSIGPDLAYGFVSALAKGGGGKVYLHDIRQEAHAAGLERIKR